jgi:hypothetical protein
MLAGTSEIGVSRLMLTSSEYLNTHASNVAFVASLFGDVLGRAADPAGLASWVQYLQNGGSRQAVIQAFLTSPENYSDILAQDYLEYLGRPLDPGGKASFLAALLSGQATSDTVAEAILASNEYFQGSH